MTRRERVLSLCVGGTLCGVALVTLVRWTVLSPFQSVKDQIAEEQRRHSSLAASLKRAAQVEDQWRALKARTLSDTDDPGVAQRRFREDMHQLLEQHGLSNPKVSPGTFIKYKDESVGVPLAISATGTLNEIVGFLCDFYRRDYLARLDKVRITADQNVIGDANTTRPRGGARPGRGAAAAANKRESGFGPDGPELKINISAVTLVLPKLHDVQADVMGAEIGLAEPPRLLRERTAYNMIFEKNPFLPHQERVAVVTSAPPPPATKTAEAAPPPPPPPPPPDGRDQKFVTATTSLHGDVAALVIDKQQKDQPPQKFQLDEPFDDGTLILVLPNGVVVRAGGRDYFYPLGKTFDQREEVDPDAHPDVWEALQAEFVGSGAGSVAGRAGSHG